MTDAQKSVYEVDGLALTGEEQAILSGYIQALGRQSFLNKILELLEIPKSLRDEVLCFLYKPSDKEQSI